MAAFSLWLASGREMQFLDAPFDDALFARLANSLRDGAWLGAYDKFTLAKGPGFPAFLALVSWLGIPLRLAEQSIYLLGCWLVAWVAGRVSGRRWLAALVFAAGSLNPAGWGSSLDRVVRENLYLGLTAVVLGLAMRVFLDTAREKRRSPRELVWGTLLGVVFGWFWLTREEGMWLAPALGLLVIDWLARNWAARPRQRLLLTRSVAAWGSVLMVPCLAFAAVDLAVAAMNRHVYGVFETNDFRSTEFRAAYGALSRIEHDHWQRLIPFPRSTRQIAYAASPAARELALAFEGSNGKGWTETGCSWLPLTPCDDIQSGWFMWALRDAAEGAGHYRSAVDAKRFYARVAKELNAACDTGTLRCSAPRAGFLPPFRREYIPFVAEDGWQILLLLARLGDEAPSDACSEDSPSAIQSFRRVALGPWTPGGAECRLVPHGDVRVTGWVFAPTSPVAVRSVAVGGDTLALAAAPDLLRSLQVLTGSAARFVGTVRCGRDPCRIVAEGGGAEVAKDVLALSPGYAVNTPGLRLFIDDVGIAWRDGPDWSRPPRTVARTLHTVLRAASQVLLPLAVLLALCFAALDLLVARRLQPLTTLWLVLLAAMSTRVGLLAVLNATSLPAISPLYLSPAVGLALLLTAGVLADAALRLRAWRGRRPSGPPFAATIPKAG